MNNEEAVKRLSAYIVCLKCEISGKECDDNCRYQYEAGTMGEIVDALETLINAEPQERKGKWIDAVLPNDNGGLPVQVCDQCNTFFPLAYTGGGHHFCPNCGCKMEVEHD